METRTGKLLIALIFSGFLIGCDHTMVEKYPSGKIKSQSNAVRLNGKEVRDGRYVEFFENGDTSLIGFYRQGKRDSTWHEYSTSHAEVKRSIYRNDSTLEVYEGTDLSYLLKGYQRINAKVLYVADKFWSAQFNDSRNTRSDGLENLKAYKSIDSGKVIVTFDYRDTWPKKFLLIPSYFYVNLLDKNAQTLDSWRSNSVYIPKARFKELTANYLFMPLGAGLDSLKKQGNLVSYKESQKNLQFLETVEFGISGLDYNPMARFRYGMTW